MIQMRIVYLATRLWRIWLQSVQEARMYYARNVPCAGDRRSRRAGSRCKPDLRVVPHLCAPSRGIRRTPTKSK